MQDILLIISSILEIISFVAYIIAIVRGQAKPHRTTRFVLLIINALSTASLLAQGNQVAVWLPAIGTFFSVIIFGLTLKKGMGGWSKMDIFCLIIALLGIVFWQITQNPIIALYFAIGADFTGMVPTLIKTFKLPSSESALFFGMSAVAAFLNLLASKDWSFPNYLYPLYILVLQLVIVLLIYRPKIILNNK